VIIVHHLAISQSERIVWLCEELDLEYELIRHERDPQTNSAPAGYKALHPFGTAPVITDGDLVLGESAAIIDYLIAHHGNGRLAVTSDAPNYPNYLYWYHFANGSLMPAAMIDMVLQKAMPGMPPAPKGSFLARADLAWDLIERRLSETPYLAGPALTAADIMTVFPLTRMRLFCPRSLEPYPAIRAYLQRIAARPAYQRAMARAEPGLAPLVDETGPA
jgi:glutathione S-transferase